jgi:low temperature requirement protein LtrA
MSGRDPDESHRVATTLELLFDLTAAIAFGAAGNELAHLLARGEVGAGLLGFSFASFAVVWAWINFTWFASAFDTDDWVYRLTTMVQMIGVVVLALGLPALFDSIAEGHTIDNRAVVLGYVVMRVPMVSQWLRAAHQDPDHRRLARSYAGLVAGSQLLWVASAFVDASVAVELGVAVPLIALEAITPVIAERFDGGSPWHPHHIAERYGLLVIVTLGEILIGAVASLSASIGEAGWSIQVAVLAVGGVGLSFGLWWLYFLFPAGEMLARSRAGSYGWAYGHLPLFASIAAVGAGLHVAALDIGGEATIGATGTLAAIAVPVVAYFVVLAALYGAVHSTRAILLSTAVKIAIVVLAFALVRSGLAISWCILLVAIAPGVSVAVTEARAG